VILLQKTCCIFQWQQEVSNILQVSFPSILPASLATVAYWSCTLHQATYTTQKREAWNSMLEKSSFVLCKLMLLSKQSHQEQLETFTSTDQNLILRWGTKDWNRSLGHRLNYKKKPLPSITFRRYEMTAPWKKIKITTRATAKSYMTPE